VVLYLCSVEKAAVLAAISDPEAGRAAALDWAAENGIGVGSDDFVEAGALFGQIMKEVQENQFRVEEREGGGSPKK